MELTDGQLKVIRKTVREVDFGSVTINISANSNKLDLSIQRRVRYEDDPGIMDLQQENELIRCGANSRRKVVKKA
jgi:hypothetical protein